MPRSADCSSHNGKVLVTFFSQKPVGLSNLASQHRVSQYPLAFSTPFASVPFAIVQSAGRPSEPGIRFLTLARISANLGAEVQIFSWSYIICNSFPEECGQLQSSFHSRELEYPVELLYTKFLFHGVMQDSTCNHSVCILDIARIYLHAQKPYWHWCLENGIQGSCADGCLLQCAGSDGFNFALPSTATGSAKDPLQTGSLGLAVISLNTRSARTIQPARAKMQLEMPAVFQIKSFPSDCLPSGP